MKVLIIRFSSFGDIIQTMASAEAIKAQYPKCEIHWVVRDDFTALTKSCPYIDRVWSFARDEGLSGLIALAKKLDVEQFTHIYDAHNNLRSQILTKFIKSKHFVRRSKERWNRFLQFRFGMRRFENPYIGQKSYVTPLKPWGVDWKIPSRPLLDLASKIPEVHQKFALPRSYVTLAPSAAWEMKRWPMDHWEELIQDLKGIPIVLLGGPEDEFIHDLAKKSSSPVLDLSGRASLLESSAIVAGSRALVSADTGLLHVADAAQIPAIALIGPTAFGYPAQKSTRVLETQLACKPCSKDGRGRCKNAVYQKCMKDITPHSVMVALRQMGAVIR